MNAARPELSQELARITRFDVKEIYADWNFDKESGLLIGVLDTEVDPDSYVFLEDVMEFVKLEPLLNQGISKLFVDWNFKEDKSYMVFIMEPKLN